MTKPSVPVYILAGGRSSRFGGDKARTLVDGVPLLLHVVRVVEPIASRRVVVAAESDAYDDLGLRTIADPLPHRGPLGGLLAALDDLDPAEAWLLLASCDWLGLQRTWLDELLAAAGRDARAVAFRGARWQPLLALYAAALRDEVRRRVVENEQLALWRVLEAAGATALPLPGDFSTAIQVNSPDDLRRWRV